MGDRVEVDLASLSTFASTLGKLADSAQTAGSQHAAELATYSSGLTAMGASTFPEADGFTRYHAALVASATSFLGDVFKGMVSLSTGANYCAVNYAGTDDLNAAEMRKVGRHASGNPYEDAVMPLRGQTRIPDRGVDRAFDPAKGEGVFGRLPAGTSAGVRGRHAAVATAGTPQSAAHDRKEQDQIDRDRVSVAAGDVAPSSTGPFDGPGGKVSTGAGSVTIPADNSCTAFTWEVPPTPKPVP